MNTGAKIAVGCGVAALLAGIVVVVGVVGLGYWAKGKAEQLTAGEERIQELHAEADQTPFTPPADGIIAEERLRTFLDVRRQVHAEYAKHKDRLEAMSQKKQGDFSDLTAGLGILGDIRLAHAQALADHDMSQAEYRYMVEQVYKTMLASEVGRQTGGKSLSEAAGDMYEQAAAAAEKAAAAEGGEGLTPEQREAMAAQQEQMKKSIAQMREQAAEAREQAKQHDVPPANIELFRKYEDDIRKYAMSGLEVVGL